MINDLFKSLTEPGLVAEIENTCKHLTFKGGDIIVEPAQFIRIIPLILKGTAKILRVDPSGNEIFLYYISSGQSCAVSLSLCLTNKQSTVKAVAEDKTELIVVPAESARRWFDSYPGWRMFVFQTMESRFDELIKTVDSLAFSNLDQRLIDFLVAKSAALKTLSLEMSHLEIANELSTSREVISRLLKRFEREGKIKLFRNRIQLLSPM